MICRRHFLARAAAATGACAAPWAAATASLAQNSGEASEREKIDAALPAQAPARPQRPRKLLIFDLNVNYGGHGSIRTSNLAFTLMGSKTGAFETVISRDPAVFQPGSLKQFHAVFLNNNVGNLFEDAALRQSLVDFVYSGGGLMGVHGTSVAFTKWPGAIEDWPEFGLMIGARGANHRANTEHVYIKLDDPAHPVNAVFGGQGFDFRDEFFRVHDPYSRNRVRVLFSIDTVKTDLQQGPAYGKLERADNDFALAWVRNYGRGRTFYCTIAHNPYVFWDAKMLQFYLAAAQFALGDLAAPTTPSGRLTPAVRAQEQLGWRLGLTPRALGRTLFESIDLAASNGVLYLEASSLQQVSNDIPKNFDQRLTDNERRLVRLKLDAAGVRLVSYFVAPAPGETAGWGKTFEFARKMGVETIVGEPPRAELDALGRLCEEHEVSFALHTVNNKSRSPYLRPEEVLKLCEGRSARLGACGDLEMWLGTGIDPVEAVRTLQGRLVNLHVHDLSERSSQARAVAWGAGVGRLDRFFEELQRLRLKPSLVGLAAPPVAGEAGAGIARSIEFFNAVTLRLAG